jgi:alpha-tubulin suppressor-like RCC1 family protein
MRRLLLLAFVLGSLGCEETENGITGPCGFGSPCAVDPIVAVTIAPPDRSLVPGDTITLSATAADSAGALVAAPVAFSSADSTIATVSVGGLITAIAPGTVVISAAAGTREASTSVEVLALLASGITAGEDVACVATNVAGRAQCWGMGDAGQLGFSPDTVCFADDPLIAGSIGCAIAPHVVSRDLHLTSISAGDSLTCALAVDGAAWCWGDNRLGQLGTGGTSRDGPQRVTAPGAAFTQVSAGGRHACGIAAGVTYCWGEDSLGQLGDARRINSTTPIPVASDESFTTVTTGLRHSCAVNVDGNAYCWGNNETGQLGTGAVGGSVEVPVPVMGGHMYTAVAAGDSSTCALRTDGAVLCWGSNAHGQLGRSSAGGSSGTPVPVPGGPVFSAVSVGAGHACAIDVAGAAYCWGRNTYGQLGAPGAAPWASPRPVDGGIAFASIASGARHTCGSTAAGTVHCWGSNVFGALGNRLQAAVRGTPVVVTLSR